MGRAVGPFWFGGLITPGAKPRVGMERAVGPFWFLGGDHTRGDAPGWNHGGSLALGTMRCLLGQRANGPFHIRPAQRPGI